MESFEMWVWRRMGKISWTERVSNDEVLRIVGEESTLIKTCKERQKKWIGHILRHDGLLKDVIEGRLEGKRLRGRKRIMMLDSNKGREPYQRMKERAQDRQGWSDFQIWNLLDSSTLQRDTCINTVLLEKIAFFKSQMHTQLLRKCVHFSSWWCEISLHLYQWKEEKENAKMRHMLIFLLPQLVNAKSIHICDSSLLGEHTHTHTHTHKCTLA